ncbi:hypothetical protein [Clostridium tetani]|uniref:Uncharacterized protein n=1 Tax=Clostridium tetani TaxID=1513 RepID=A0A4Q0VEN1_CLOTA|nr:hypothetical protein [Clostridium tetani]CDI50313.1 hypothetical protein BN906_02329 [Clostridium tetani 12124569]KHO36215.1 hypothetical protein OR62_11290 [Clostridium tetani]RXI49116.1 hypothetical protein DP130_06820 [Clostridium tetani]RXI55926.1 hypothetical protein DP131_07725 [Clostridium tetani]RXI66051.1 hypothetical protein DQN76_13400 [Clostridium tetani]
MLSRGFCGKVQDEIEMILVCLDNIYDSKNKEEIGEAVGKIQDELDLLNNDVWDFLSTLRTMFDFEEN